MHIWVDGSGLRRQKPSCQTNQRKGCARSAGSSSGGLMKKIALATQCLVATISSLTLISAGFASASAQGIPAQQQSQDREREGPLGGGPVVGAGPLQGVNPRQEGPLQGGGPLDGKGPLQGDGPLRGDGPLVGSGPLQGDGPLQGAGPLMGTGPLQGDTPIIDGGPAGVGGPVADYAGAPPAPPLQLASLPGVPTALPPGAEPGIPLLPTSGPPGGPPSTPGDPPAPSDPPTTECFTCGFTSPPPPSPTPPPNNIVNCANVTCS
jgi:hypothetical protein